jgi:hypothetical protein
VVHLLVVLEGVKDPGEGTFIKICPLVARFSFSATVKVTVDELETVVTETDENKFLMDV